MVITTVLLCSLFWIVLIWMLSDGECSKCKDYPTHHVSKLMNEILELKETVRNTAMIKQSESLACANKLQKKDELEIQLLNQIQELKAINNYQVTELEQKIAELERDLLLEKHTTCKGDHSEVWKDLSESIKIRDLEENTASLEQEVKSLKERLESSEKEVKTLSGVLCSEPIMEALGNKKSNKEVQ